ncbi:hypothetical protein K0M31_008655 [Melipona bicolor]|uniref:Uncharacterized protein n=1 Tax=Melipona bicolor TaxID=60889 RepID=A0AA40FPJ8_9HYME|nr:hypothetical protein K0M31_008655 [Melipona bicolor]
MSSPSRIRDARQWIALMVGASHVLSPATGTKLQNRNFATDQVPRGVKLLIELQTYVEALNVITDNKPGEGNSADGINGCLAQNPRTLGNSDFPDYGTSDPDFAG